MESGRKTHKIALLEIRHLIEKSTFREKFGSPERADDLHTEMKSLNQKFDELKDIVIGVKMRGESVKKVKTRKEVISLVQQHRKLSAAQLATIIGLSRVRANEYLRELEREGIAKGVVVDRVKFYTIPTDVT